MYITSPHFVHNELIPSKYTFDGMNVNPSIQIHDIPEETLSLALIMEDPDASEGTLTHWMLWNINPEITTISSGKIPEGSIEGVNDFGNNGYKGPIPDSGTHQYIFKIFALDDFLDLDSDSTRTELEEAIQDKILDQHKLIGLYSRFHKHNYLDTNDYLAYNHFLESDPEEMELRALRDL